MFRDALNLLGFGTPFAYATATYFLFHFLDKNASGPARDAISAWLKSVYYDKSAVAAAVVEIFDRLYTRPLLSWRAFVRSIIFTIIVTTMFLIEFDVPRPPIKDVSSLRYYVADPSIFWIFWFPILQNLLSDYISLFAVRKWLQIAGKQPIFALIAAILVGAIIIIALYAIRGFLTNVLARWIYWGEFPGFKFVWSSFYSSVTSVNFTGKYLIPAVAVHAWILLFGLGAIIVKLLGYFAWSVDKTQWFLKRGRNHSLQAIGYVGGAIVFVSTVLYQAMARGI